MSPGSISEESISDFCSPREGCEMNHGQDHGQEQMMKDHSTNVDEFKECDVILGGAESIGKSGYM